jgi:hypothetical protein
VPDQFLKASPRKLQIRLPRSLPGLLEAMQDMNRALELRDVDHPEGARRIAYAKLPDAAPDVRHWLPVDRVEPALNPVKLKSRGVARGVGETT